MEIGLHLKKLFKHSIIYGIGGTIDQIIRFLLIPIYTRFLTPADYGIVSIVTLMGSLVTIVFGMGVSTSLFRYYFESNEQQKRDRVVSTAFMFITVESLILLIAMLVFSGGISRLLLDTNEYRKYIIISLLTSFLSTSVIIPFIILRAKEKSKLFVVGSIVKLLVSIAFKILFVVVLKRGALGVLEAGLISEFLIYAVFIGWMLKKIRLGFSFPDLKKILNYGYPLVIAGFGIWVLNMSDRYFLKKFASLNEVGLYSLGYTMGMAILLFVTAFRNAWPQIMFSVQKEKRAGEFYSSVLTYYILIIMFVWLCISVLAKEIILIMAAPAYLESYRVIPCVALSYVFMGVAAIVSAGIYIRNKTIFDAVIMAILAVVNIVLNLILIKRYGMMGAAYATLISYVFLAVCYHFIGLKYLKIIYEKRRIIKIFATCFLIYFGSLLIVHQNIYVSLLLKAGLLCSYPGVLLLVAFYKKKEKEKISIFYSKLKMTIVSKPQ